MELQILLVQEEATLDLRAQQSKITYASSRNFICKLDLMIMNISGLCHGTFIGGDRNSISRTRIEATHE